MRVLRKTTTAGPRYPINLLNKAVEPRATGGALICQATLFSRPRLRLTLALNPMDSLVIGAVMIIVGISLLWTQRRFIFLGWQSRKWKRTGAKIVDGKFYEGLHAPKLAVFFDQTQCVYSYKYHVSGHSYISTDYSFAGGQDPAPIEWLVGGHVTIHYDPTDPARAVVKPGIRPITVAPGITLIIAGAYLLIAAMGKS